MESRGRKRRAGLRCAGGDLGRPTALGGPSVPAKPLGLVPESTGDWGLGHLLPQWRQRPCGRGPWVPSGSASAQSRGQGGAPSLAASGPRSPPRPSPGGLHYSDEDICNKYNGAVLAGSTALQEKSVDASESEVSVAAPPAPVPSPLPPPGAWRLVSVGCEEDKGPTDRRGRGVRLRAQTRSPGAPSPSHGLGLSSTDSPAGGLPEQRVPPLSRPASAGPAQVPRALGCGPSSPRPSQRSHGPGAPGDL